MAVRKTSKRKTKKDGKMGFFGIFLVVSIFAIFMYTRIEASNKDLSVLEEKKTEIETELSKETDRQKDLEKEKVYVKTKMYVEDMAKKLGLVYPDEIIYRPENK
jgi:cell division protein FtsB